MGNANFVFEYDRQKLVLRIQENRDNHVATYEEAWQGYLIEVQEQLDELAKSVRKSAKALRDAGSVKEFPADVETGFYVDATPPQNHSDEYDRVIDMLVFTDEEKITLTPQEFNQYVRDEWSWSQQFASSTQTLITKNRAR